MPRAMARCSECEYHMTFNPKNMAQHLDIHGHQCWQMTILKPLQMLSSFPGIFDLHISSSISSIGLKHSQNEFGKEKKPWGNPWDNIVVKPGASSRWNRFPAFGFTRGLAALLVGRVLGRFRYAYHLRPWEKFDVYVGISYYSNYWCWWTGFFLLMILAMNVFKAFHCERYPKVYKKADGSKLPNKNRASLQTAFKQFGYLFLNLFQTC